MLKTSIDLTRLFKQAITYVVLASLQLGTLTQTKEAYAQNVPQMAQLGAPSSAPFSGYNPDGTLYMGGQRIGNPHQVLHDAQIPAFMTITANRYTYSADPTHGQGTLAQMELATTNGSTSSVLLNRLYLSPNNPYATTQPLGQVWPYPNYQTYQGVLLNSQQAGYLGTTAQDGKDYLFKTLTAASSQAFTILIKELPNTPQFRAAADPAGGGVGVRVEQNGDAAALANYYKTVQPYDFTWRPNAGLYTGSGNGSGQNGQLDPMYSGWANSPGGAYSGANYAEGSGAPQSFNDFIKQQQAEALANDKRVRSQTTANSLDLSNTNVNTLFGEGYNLFDYGNKANPNLAAENEYLRKLQNGEFNAGSADYIEASRIAQERYRIAYATRLETNKPLQYSVADSQRKANELNLLDTNPNKLFGDGYDLFKYDPLTNPNGAAENALLTRLQSGQLTPGSAEHDEAKSIAQQRYRNAYSNSLAFNVAPKFTVADAQRKANEIDLSSLNPNELFGQGFDLFQYNPALRPNGEAENVLLARLQNGELTVGSPEYLEATQIAQQRLRDAYSISLVPPEPKKIPKWKLIAGAVVGAILTYVSAGTLGPYVASALGTLASTTIITGSLSKGFEAAGRSLIKGIVKDGLKGLVTGFLSYAFGVDLSALDGVALSLANITIDSLSNATAETLLNGGSFGNNLQHAMVTSVTEELAKGIGEKFAGDIKNADLGDIGTELAHGALGCVTGTIRAQSGDGCAPGAAGAVGGHLIAPVIFGTGFDPLGTGTVQGIKDSAIFFSGVVGGAVAAAVGKDDQVNANYGLGSAAGSNAAENNALSSLKNRTAIAEKLGKQLKTLDDAFINKGISGEQYLAEIDKLNAVAAKIDAAINISNANGKIPLAELIGKMTPNQIATVGEAVGGLLYVPGAIDSAYQLLTGKTATGEEANYFFAALGILPVAGMVKGLDNLADITKALGSAENVAAASRNAANTAEIAKTCVYSCVINGTTRYVGITDDIAARGSAHMREKGIRIAEIDGLENLSRADTRAVEQVLIEYHGLGTQGGTLMNKINSISQTNKPTVYEAALIRGRELLKQNNYPGF